IHLPSSTFFTPGTASTGTAVPTHGGAPASSDASGSFGGVEGKGIVGELVCDPRTVREWFTRPTLAGAFSPVIKARPVLDLDEFAGGDGYQPPRRVREHVTLSHSGCIFPFCTRPAHVCDIDHTEPWKPDGTGGATCTCNLAPACRTHHRLKTHADNAPVTSGEHSKWSYVHLGNEEYYWTGPRGMEFIRTNTGTYNASPSRNDGAPPHPGARQPSASAGPIALGD